MIVIYRTGLHLRWHQYTGRVRITKSGRAVIPNGGRGVMRLGTFAMFDTDTTPPTLTRADFDIDAIPANLIPPLFIDRRGCIRDRQDMRLVLAGPDWDDASEAEYQRSRDLPF